MVGKECLAISDVLLRLMHAYQPDNQPATVSATVCWCTSTQAGYVHASPYLFVDKVSHTVAHALGDVGNDLLELRVQPEKDSGDLGVLLHERRIVASATLFDKFPVHK